MQVKVSVQAEPTTSTVHEEKESQELSAEQELAQAMRYLASWEQFDEWTEQERQRRLAAQSELERQARLIELERRKLLRKEQLEKIEEYKTELNSLLQQTLTKLGYLPPQPSPFLCTRALKTLTSEVQARRRSDLDFASALHSMERAMEEQYKLSHGYLKQLRMSLDKQPSLLQKVKLLSAGIQKSINQAFVTIGMPEVAPSLKKQMTEIEHFLATDWVEGNHRGVLAVHVDEASQSTILQIGIAEHGPIYITIPAVLRPESRAMKAIREVIRRLTAFSDVVDPMAIIDGSHQGLNYNQIFLNTRVVRAPSGNTSRLALNMRETAQRERLSSDNTMILNSAPGNREEYVRVFKGDPDAYSWPSWGDEAQLWNATAVKNRFAPSQEVSQEALLTALTEAKNVIVIVAHCDGESIFMPAPPPEGSEVDADYLLAHREQIAANAPFVYLFSCEAGKLSNLQNFASTLLECGASGVIASQSTLGSAEGRVLLGRLLDEERGAPPIEDYFKAMREVNFRDMEVFLA